MPHHYLLYEFTRIVAGVDYTSIHVLQLDIFVETIVPTIRKIYINESHLLDVFLFRAMQ